MTVNGSGFARDRNTVKFGIGYVGNLPSADGRTITFVVPDALDLCRPGAPGPCPAALPPVRPGEYAVSVLLGDRTSNSVTFTVTDR